MPATFDLIVREARVVTDDGMRVADIGVRDGAIAAVGPALSGASREEIDARGLHAFPGTVDIHVHFNDPGRADWEGWASGSAASAAGGTTTVAEMPLNAHPPTLDAASIAAKVLSATGQSRVDFALWGGLTPVNLGAMSELASCGVIGFKAFMCNSGIDDFLAADSATLREGMARAAELGLPVAVHAESEAISQELTTASRQAGKTSPRDYLETRPIHAEVAAIQEAISLAEETGCVLHVVHVSSAAGVAKITAAKARGLAVSAETCPHYFTFDEIDLLNKGAILKCAPPLRAAREADLLWSEVEAGNVDIVASDHSPSPPSLKTSDDFFAVWGGISGCQSLTTALLSEAIETGLPLHRAAKMLAAAPSRLLRLPRKGKLAVGYDADIHLVDVETLSTLEEHHLHYRHPVSPYVGFPLHTSSHRTILRGQTIALQNAPVGPPIGTLLRPEARA